MAISCEEISGQQARPRRVIILNYGLPHEPFRIGALAEKYKQEGIEAHIIEILSQTNQLAQPLPFKIDERTKVIVQAHGAPASKKMYSSDGRPMTTKELADIIAQNMKQGVTQVQVSLCLCYGGVGESLESHENSFACHFLYDLSECGIDNSTVSARLGAHYFTSQGRHQVQLKEDLDKSIFCEDEYLLYFSAENRERYMNISKRIVFMETSGGKLRGSKVIVSRNKKKELITSYPYGRGTVDCLGMIPDSILELHRNYNLQCKRIIRQAKYALNDIFLEIKRQPKYQGLLKNKEVLSALSRVNDFTDKTEAFDAETLGTLIRIQMGSVKNIIQEAYWPLLSELEEDFKNKMNKTANLKHHIIMLERLLSLTIDAVYDVEDHIFVMNKMRKKIKAIDPKLNAEAIFPYDTTLVYRWQLHILYKLGFVSSVTVKPKPIAREKLYALSKEELVELARLVTEKEIFIMPPAGDREWIERHIELAKEKYFSDFKTFIRDLFKEKFILSLEFFEPIENVPATVEKLLEAINLAQMKEAARLLLQDGNNMVPEKIKFLCEILADDYFYSIEKIREKLQWKLNVEYGRSYIRAHRKPVTLEEIAMLDWDSQNLLAELVGKQYKLTVINEVDRATLELFATIAKFKYESSKEVKKGLSYQP